MCREHIPELGGGVPGVGERDVTKRTCVHTTSDVVGR